MNLLRIPFAAPVLLLTLALTLALPLPSRAAPAKKLRVTTTITMIADLVQNVGGDRVEVTGLMGPGVDPHLYKARASDVSKLRSADVIFYCGLLLEGRMQDLFIQMARSKKAVYAVTEGLPVEKLLAPPEFAGHYDPHVWFDLPLWSECVATVVEGLTAADPGGQAYYLKQGAELRQKLGRLNEWVQAKVAEVPERNRILVTSHDAFNYFGRAYGFQVVALQGISTADEAGLADVTQLVDFVKKNRVPAIFIESSVPPATIQRISKDSGVAIGGELFSDAMGTPGQMEDGYDLGTFEGMIRHNVNTIVRALK